MILRTAGVALILSAATAHAAADEVTSNRGVACRDRAEAAALHKMTERKDHAGWAKASGALMAAGRCVLLLQGTAVTLKAPPAEGLAKVEAKGQAAPLWIEAASVGTPILLPLPVLPDRMGDRRAAPGGVYGCGALGTIAAARRLLIENDEAAHRELIRREVDAGRCQVFAAGAEIVWQERKPHGVAIVRQVGKPDRLWIDEDVWRIEAAKAAPAAAR
jgi:hypothetical protein